MNYESIKVLLLLLGFTKINDASVWKKDDITITISTYGRLNPLIKVKELNHTKHFFHFDIFNDYLDGIKLTKGNGRCVTSYTKHHL